MDQAAAARGLRSSSAKANFTTQSPEQYQPRQTTTHHAGGYTIQAPMASTSSYHQQHASQFGQPTTSTTAYQTVGDYYGGGSRGYSTGMGTTRTVSTGQERVQSERLVSSNVIDEQQLGPAPEGTIQYIEVPVIEEVIRHVPKREVVEIEKRVPRYEYEWVERIVEVPQIQVVEKMVEVPQIQEVIKHVPVRQVVEVPREVVRYVPKIETKIVEQEVEVPGETIEIPKPYTVENRVVVPRFIDKEVPTVVAQRLHPIITESETDFVDVELKEYNPQLIAVDVYIPRPVARNLIAAAKYEEHRVVDVPPAQYNALVKTLNVHMAEKDADTIYVKMQDGSVPMLHGMGTQIIQPLSMEWEKYHTKGQQHITYTQGMVMPNMSATGYGQQHHTQQQHHRVVSSGAQQYYAQGGQVTRGSTAGLIPLQQAGMTYAGAVQQQVLAGGGRIMTGGGAMGPYSMTSGLSSARGAAQVA